MSASPAAADDDSAERRGPCSAGRSEWRARIDDEGSRLKLEFKVNQHRASTDVWDMTVEYNGTVIFDGTRTSSGRDGEVRVRATVRDQAGADTLRGVAVNQSTGVTCEGTVTLA